MTEPVQSLLAHLKGVRAHQGGWQARCPAHDDHTPSLSLTQGPDGRALLHCHTGCPPESIVQALGLDWGDLFTPDTNGNGKHGLPPQIDREYSYTDEAGDLLFQVVRYIPKDFRQRHLGPHGWAWGAKDIRRVLYRLPQVLAAVQAPRVVFVVEGEKDSDLLASWGLVGTTNVGGAGKWRPEYTACLSGARVVILPDNDDPGQAHADAVAQSLVGIARSIRLVELPGLPAKGDLSEWAHQGGTASQLQALVTATPRYERRRIPRPADPDVPSPADSYQQARREAQLRARAIATREGLHFPWPAVDRLTGPLVPGMLVVVGGRAKQGKSTFLRECFDAWVGNYQKKIMYIGTEQSVGETRALWACQYLGLPPEAINLAEHQDAILDDIEGRQGAVAERGLIYVPDTMDLDTLTRLTHLAAHEGCDAVLFDHFTRLDLKGRRAKWEESAEAIKAVKCLARTANILVIVGAQLTDGDGAFGLHDVPTGANWAYTRDLQRECDIALAIWRPLTRAPTTGERQAGRNDLSLVTRLIEPNTMALRVVAHRLQGSSALEGGCRLLVHNGRISPV